jgi:hypothetical protein
LNDQLFLEHEKPVDIGEILYKIGKSQFLTSIDIYKAYWQIPIREEDRKYTGFSFGGQTFVFLVLPFGLATAVSSFTRGMQIILGDDILKFTVIYIDDCLITSRDFEEHLSHIDQLLKS